MNKFLHFCISLVMMLSFSFTTTFASEIQSSSEIDPYIYELINSYDCFLLGTL